MTHRLLERYVELLTGLGDGKLKDGHWPITPFECRAALTAGTDLLHDLPDGRRLSLPWSPTTFLNIYYAYALASADRLPEAGRRRTGSRLMAAFGAERTDLLADDGRATFASVGEDFGDFDGVASALRTADLDDVFRLAAVQTAFAEAVGWFTHRLHSELHGPYQAPGGRSYLVRTLNLTYLPHDVPAPWHGVTRLHAVFRLRDQPGPLLDFFGHLRVGLGSVTDAAAVFSVSDGNEVVCLTPAAVRHTVSRLVRALSARIAGVTSMTPAMLCAEFGRLYLVACLAATGAPDPGRHPLVAAFPEAIEPGTRWLKSRAEFLTVLAMRDRP